MDRDEQPFGISESEQRSLLGRIARGDEAARERLLRAYEPLVGSIARRSAAPGTVDYEDRCQEGRIALIGALGAFKPDAGASFGSYAKQWLIGAMKRDPSRAIEARLGLEDDEIPEDPGADDHVHLMGQFVGGQESGRDAYLQHASGEFADVLGHFAGWLAEGGMSGEVNPRVWGHLCRAEHELLAAVREGQSGALARLEQKYSQLLADFIPDERAHRSDELRLGPDARSAALAGLVAHAVAVGSLPERAWHARLAERGICPHNGPGFVPVEQFRRRVLAGRLIAQEEVAQWIEAQLAREGEPAPAYLRVPLSEAELAALEGPAGKNRAAYATLLAGTAARSGDRVAGRVARGSARAPASPVLPRRERRAAPRPRSRRCGAGRSQDARRQPHGALRRLERR